MPEEMISVLNLDIAVALVSAIKGAEGFIILSRDVGEEIDGEPSMVLVYESINTGAIYTFPYKIDDYGNGTSGIQLLNGGVQLEGHGDTMYTLVQKISDVPDTIESLFKDS